MQVLIGFRAYFWCKIPVFRRCNVSLLCGALLACPILVRASSESKPKPASLSLSGTFEDTFAGKHNTAGSFEVQAGHSNALIQMDFESGFREICGTDGRYSFTYQPLASQETDYTNASGMGTISLGRFPTNAHFFQQVLWLVCTRDSEFLTNAQRHRFYFYGDYAEQEVTTEVQMNEAAPYLVASVQWLAPGKLASGTNRYDLALYPEGWLMADLSVTTTSTAAGLTLPSKVIFSRYATHSITNASRLRKLPVRDPGDVRLVGTTVFWFTNVQTIPPPTSFVPEIGGRGANVYDHRRQERIYVGKGRAWAARDILAQHDWTFRVDDADYGVVSRDAQVIRETKVQPYTLFKVGNHSLRIPVSISSLAAIALPCLALLLLGMAAIAWRRRK